MTDSSLASMEFTLASLNNLWESGLQDNVIIHKQYRALSEENEVGKLLVRNLLDGLAAARALHTAEDMAHYLQRLEVLGRAENTDAIVDFIANALKNSAPLRGVQQSCATAPPSSTVEPMTSSPFDHAGLTTGSSAPAPAANPTTPTTTSTPSLFLTEADKGTLARQQQLLNATVAAKLHVDGPECVVQYTTDPTSKRAQVRFIDEVARQHELHAPPPATARSSSKRTAAGKTKATLVKSATSSVAADKWVTSTVGATGLPRAAPHAPHATVDYAQRRPFQLK